MSWRTTPRTCANWKNIEERKVGIRFGNNVRVFTPSHNITKYAVVVLVHFVMLAHTIHNMRRHNESSVENIKGDAPTFLHMDYHAQHGQSAYTKPLRLGHDAPLYQHSNPTTEAYGFALSMATAVVWVLWVVWAITPEWLLMSVGIRWFPNRYAMPDLTLATGLTCCLHGALCSSFLFMSALCHITLLKHHHCMH